MSRPYTIETLDSGLRLLMSPMENTKTATVLVLVGTGSKYETKDINGISHFLEHMMFKGTKKRPTAMDISLELDLIGADYNAFTSKEYTGYYAKSSSDNLDKILDVVTDIFLNSHFNEEEIKKEKNVIVEEINMYLDKPQRYVNTVFDNLLYGDQPAGWDVTGEKETVVKFNRGQFVDYFSTHYTAGNTIIAVAGQFDPDVLRLKIAGIFENIRKADKVNKVSVVEKQVEPGIKLHEKKTDQTHFMLGVRSFEINDERNEALEILSTILGGGMSSRLFDEVREKRGLAYYVFSSSDAMTDCGYFYAQAGVDNTRLEKAVEVVINEFKKIQRDGLSEKDLDKARRHIKGRMAISLESSDDVANFYAGQLLLEKEILTLEEKFAKIEKVTVENVHEVARQIFRKDNINLALVGPYKDEQKLREIIGSI